MTRALCLFAAAALLATGPALRAVSELEKEMPADAHRLQIGDPAPDFSLPGIDGKTYTLDDFKAAPVLMVAFLSNHCPYSHAAETRLLPLYAKYKDRGLAVVAINPNNPAGLDLSELGYSKYNDTFADMKLYAHDRGFTFPYIYDGETQRVAKAYGCLCTPDLFIFDASRRLRYKGRLDNSQYPEADTVNTHEAQDAIDALLAGQPVAVAETAPFGCATKWIEKHALVTRINEQWESTPVTIEGIDAAGVAALVRNDSPRVRLINVWATWCVPCVEEMPALDRLQAQLGDKLTILAISEDRQGETVVAPFLEQHAIKHLGIFLDPKSAATSEFGAQGLPTSYLIARDGTIVGKEEGGAQWDSAEMIAKLTPYIDAQ